MPEKNNQNNDYFLSQILKELESIKNIVYGTDESKSIISRIDTLEYDNKHNEKHKEEIFNIKDRIFLLEKEDKRERTKIIIFLILLLLSQFSSFFTKITEIIENIIKAS